jgi:ATP-binding cassette subfamily F protein 3
LHQYSDINVNNDQNVLDFVLNSDSETNELNALKLETENIIDKTEEEGDSTEPDYMNKLEILYGKLEKIEAVLEKNNSRVTIVNAKKILRGLNFTDDDFNRWQKRVMLACALFVSSDILLLDEPTNHLDFPTIRFLEKYINTSCKQTLIIVSHDRLFIDNCTSNTIELSNKSLRQFSGNYSTFSTMRSEEIQREQNKYTKQQIKMKQLKAFIHDNQNAKYESILQTVAQKKRFLIEEENNLVKDPLIEQQIKLTFQRNDDNLNNQSIVEINNLSYKINDKLLFKNFSANIRSGDRIAITGVNGCGKTTLIKLIMQELKPQYQLQKEVDKNEDDDDFSLIPSVKLNSHTIVRYFSQHHYELESSNQNCVEYMNSIYPNKKEQEIVAFLCSIGFSHKQLMNPVKILSGGEKVRLVLSQIMMSTPHLIILDEVTNHLDLQTVESLITALESFTGAIIIISHDQYFLSKMTKYFWSFSGNSIKILHDFDDVISTYTCNMNSE